MNSHAEARGQQHPHKRRLFKSDKKDDNRHKRYAEPFEINTENIALEIAACCITVIIIRHDPDADECQHDGNNMAMSFYGVCYLHRLTRHSK